MKLDLIVRVDGEELVRKYEMEDPLNMDWNKTIASMIKTIDESHEHKF